jgi:hypothetical protein
VSGGLNRLLVVAIAGGTLLVALVAPSVASASCNGRPSAANVYKECLAGGGGGGKKHTGGGKTTGPSSSSPTTTVVPISPETKKALKQAGRQRRVLSALVRGYGVSRLAQPSSPTSEVSTPTAIGSAFDLGSGPTALLLVLAGTAVLLLGGSGMRVWRSRHRS